MYNLRKSKLLSWQEGQVKMTNEVYAKPLKAKGYVRRGLGCHNVTYYLV